MSPAGLSFQASFGAVVALIAVYKTFGERLRGGITLKSARRGGRTRILRCSRGATGIQYRRLRALGGYRRVLTADHRPRTKAAVLAKHVAIDSSCSQSCVLAEHVGDIADGEHGEDGRLITPLDFEASNAARQFHSRSSSANYAEQARPNSEEQDGPRFPCAQFISCRDNPRLWRGEAGIGITRICRRPGRRRRCRRR